MFCSPLADEAPSARVFSRGAHLTDETIVRLRRTTAILAQSAGHPIAGPIAAAYVATANALVDGAAYPELSAEYNRVMAQLRALHHARPRMAAAISGNSKIQ